jgi:hypothetical protein
MSSRSSRARSRETSPDPVIRAVGSTSGSIRDRLSTATAISGRSSDRVSDMSVRGWRRAPKPSAPRSKTLVATSCRPYRSSSASAAKRPPALLCRSPK